MSCLLIIFLMMLAGTVASESTTTITMEIQELFLIISEVAA